MSNFRAKVNELIDKIRQLARTEATNGKAITINGRKAVRLKISTLAYKLNLYPQYLYTFLPTVTELCEDIERERGAIVVYI